MRTLFATLMLCAAGPLAHASLIFSSADVFTGSGFGSDPRILTIQATGDASVESGCDAWSGTALLVGSTACSNPSNVGGDEPNPHGFPKDSSPELSQLGYTQASQVGIIFDATEPGNKNSNGLIVDSLILKFYAPSGTLLLSEALTPTPFGLSSTTTGNGKTDYLFVLDQNGINQVNSDVFSLADSGSVHIGLESTLSNVACGPESFLAQAYSTGNTSATPEPASLFLIGSGLLGAGLFRRRLSR